MIANMIYLIVVLVAWIILAQENEVSVVGGTMVILLSMSECVNIVFPRCP